MASSKREKIINAFNRTGTDKVLHGYDEVYAKIFDVFPINSIIEVGVLHGWSLMAWRHLLGPGRFVGGFDLRRPTDSNDNRLRALDIKFEYGIDSVKRNKVYQPATIVGKMWFNPDAPTHWSVDLFIDDGSHKMEDQMNTFRNFKAHFNHAYVIEDVIGDESVDYLRDRITGMGYDLLVNASVRYTEEEVLEDKVKTNKVYILTVTRPGKNFGNADS